MDLSRALTAVLHGASMQQVAVDARAERLAALGLRPDDAEPAGVRDAVTAFMRSLARHFGDRHAGDPRIGQALREWVRHCDHYEAWDALLSGFDVEGRHGLLRRGKLMFPGPLTAHWVES